MNTVKSLLSDLRGVLLSPQRFFNERFLQMESKSIFILGYLGTFFGLFLGSVFTAVISHVMVTDFTNNPEPYLATIKSLGLTESSFLELIKAQKAYCILMIVLSPLLAYIAPHLLGGALFIFLWLLVRPEKTKPSFLRVMECTAMALTSVAYYGLPLLGPFVALVMVVLNVSRAITVQYQIIGFMKIMSVLSAIYICFFLASTSLQLLAMPLAAMLK